MIFNYPKTFASLLLSAGLCIINNVNAQMSYSDAISKASAGNLITTTIACNRKDGTVSFITGNLSLGGVLSKALVAPAEINKGGLNEGQLIALYSDRVMSCQSSGNSLPGNPNPFNINKPEYITVGIFANLKGGVSALFTIGKRQYTVNLKNENNYLYGVGESTDNASKQAFYVINFTGTTPIQQPPLPK